MRHNHVTGGSARRRTLAFHLAACTFVVVAACGGTSDQPTIPWSDDPCGLVPPQAVADAFGEQPTLTGGAPAGECRYRVGGTLLRIVVLADGDHCEGAERAYTALGISLSRPDGERDGIFVAEPDGDVLVCEAEVTYTLSGSTNTAALLEIAATPAEERRD